MRPRKAALRPTTKWLTLLAHKHNLAWLLHLLWELWKWLERWWP